MQIDAALPIVRALADGVNPITGEAYPEQSPYAEPRTLRALYSAVDLMQKEIEREKRRERLPANFGKPWTAEEDGARNGGVRLRHAAGGDGAAAPAHAKLDPPAAGEAGEDRGRFRGAPGEAARAGSGPCPRSLSAAEFMQ